MSSVSVISIIRSLVNPAYYGNPNPPFAGQNAGQPYVFLSFYAESAGDMFDKIVFIYLPLATSLETDNHPFSATLQAPAGVPQPASLTIFGMLLLLVAGRYGWARRSQG